MKSGRHGRLRRFNGRTVAEAMQRLKHSLGSDAIIVSVQKGRKRYLGLFGPRLVEITASADTGGQPVYRREGRRSRPRLRAVAPVEPPPPAPPPPIPQPAEEPALAPRATTRRLRRELEGIKHLAMDLILQGKESALDDLPGAWREWYHYLGLIGLSRETAQGVVLRCAGAPEAAGLAAEQVAQRVRSALIERIPLAPPIGLPDPAAPRALALVGPPGVGKTTALMKLAAQLVRQRRGAIGLLSLDTRRIGAAESLESCAQMIGVPFQAAAGPQEIGVGLAALGDLPLVLVDTPGRNPNNAQGLAELSALLGKLGRTRTHLVLSAADSVSFLSRAIARYGAFEPASTIVTKLDESATPASLVEIAPRLPGGISHLGCGQTIPGDLLPAGRETLEQWLFLPAGQEVAS